MVDAAHTQTGAEQEEFGQGRVEQLQTLQHQLQALSRYPLVEAIRAHWDAKKGGPLVNGTRRRFGRSPEAPRTEHSAFGQVERVLATAIVPGRPPKLHHRECHRPGTTTGTPGRVVTASASLAEGL